MRIVVLAKEVPDPEAAVSLDVSGRIVLPPNTPRLLNTYDENAIEAAVALKEAVDAQVTVITLGPESAEKVAIQAMAMGADDGILIQEPTEPLDGVQVAAILAAAVRRLGPVDLILCGREAADSSGGLVGPTIAEILGCPASTVVSKISIQAGDLIVERPVEKGYLTMKCTGPVLLTVSGEANRPRYPAVMAMMKARRKGVQRLTLADLDLESTLAGDRRVTVVGYRLPSTDQQCEFIEYGTAAENAGALVDKLQHEQVI